MRNYHTVQLNHHPNHRCFGCDGIVTLALPRRSLSQLSLMPSTDVVSKKGVPRFDFLSHFESHADGGFQIYAPRAVFGVGKGVEVGVNVTAADAFAPDQPVYISPNAKWQFYSNEDNGVAISGGGLLYTPLVHRAGADTFGFVYSVVSKKVKSDYGPRFRAALRVRAANGAGTQGGPSWAMSTPSGEDFRHRLFSGKNAFGYVTARVYTPPKQFA